MALFLIFRIYTIIRPLSKDSILFSIWIDEYSVPIDYLCVNDIVLVYRGDADENLHL